MLHGLQLDKFFKVEDKKRKKKNRFLRNGPEEHPDSGNYCIHI